MPLWLNSGFRNLIDFGFGLPRDSFASVTTAEYSEYHEVREQIEAIMIRPSLFLKTQMKALLESLYNELDPDIHYCVGPNDDEPNVCRMPKVSYNTNGDINRQKATWRKVIDEAPDTVVNSPRNVARDCWFSTTLKSDGKLDRGSEPFKSYKLNRKGNKWTLPNLILILKNPHSRTFGLHQRTEDDDYAHVENTCSHLCSKSFPYLYSVRERL